MATATQSLQALVGKFTEIAKSIYAGRLALGDLLNEMLAGYDMAFIRTELKAALPDKQARQMLGFAITAPNLEALALAARTFREGGGIVSPDELHAIGREDIEVLQLEPQELGKLAVLVASGDVRVKDIEAVVERVRKDKNGVAGKRGSNAVAHIKGIIEPSAEPVVKTISDWRNDLAKVNEKIGKLEVERARIQAQIKALETTPTEAAPVQASAPASAKRIPTATAPLQASATA